MTDRRSGGDKQEPTLELPKLFGRRRRGAQPPAPTEEPVEPSPPERSESGAHAAVEAAPAPARATAPAPAPTTRDPEPFEPTVPVEEPGARKAERTTPLLRPRLAAVLTGLVVGLTGTLLTYGALRGCEAWTGTGSCGGGPGLLLLLAIAAAMVLLGGVLLTMWSVTDPRSTSLLAVGITAVVVMLTLLEAVFSVWAFLAVPLVCMAAYVAAHWVTTRFADVEREGPGVDVR